MSKDGRRMRRRGIRRYGWRLSFPVLLLGLSLGLAACGGSSKGSAGNASASSGSKGPWKIILSENDTTDPWYQQGNKTAELAARRTPFAGKVEFSVRNSELSAQSQIATLNSIIAQKPDAILLNPASPTAINPTIQRACAAGIVVITYNAPATASCAFKVNPDFEKVGQAVGAWLGQAVGKGSVAVDTGLAGASDATVIYKNFEKGLAKYPGMTIAGHFEGGYEPGKEQQGVASILAKEPNLSAGFTIANGFPVISAFKQAGRMPQAIAGTDNNRAELECMKHTEVKCMFWNASPGVTVLALQTAVEVLEKKRPNNGSWVYEGGHNLELFSNGTTEIKGFPEAKITQMKVGVNAFPKLPPLMSVPIVPSGVPVEVTAEEVEG